MTREGKRGIGGASRQWEGSGSMVGLEVGALGCGARGIGGRCGGRPPSDANWLDAFFAKDGVVVEAAKVWWDWTPSQWVW